MGEISFKYNAKIKPIQETSFHYLFSKLKKYIIFYKRYVALSDTNILNNPVAITKVATGFYNLYELFIDKTIYNTMYSDIINIDKINNQILINKEYYLNRSLYLNIFNNYNTKKINKMDDLKIMNNYYIKKKNEIYINKNKYYNLATKYIKNNYFKHIILKNYNNDININKNVHLDLYTRKLNKLDNQFLKNYNNETNINKNIYLNKINNDNVNINKNVYLNRTKNDNIYINKIIYNKKYNFNLDISNLIYLNNNYYKLNTIKEISLKFNNLTLSYLLNCLTEKNNNDSLNIYNDFNDIKNKNYKLFVDNSYIDNLIKNKHNSNITKQLVFKKYFSNIILFEYYFSNKKKQNIDIFRNSKFIIKNKIFTSTYSIDSIIKNNIPFNYTNIIFNDYNNTIIPVSKTKQNIYTNKINIKIQKIIKNITITKQTTASVVSKSIETILFNTFYDKNKIDPYLDYKNILITKNNIRINIYNDLFINKKIPCIDYYNQGYFKHKNSKNIINFNNIQTKKDSNSIINYEYIWTNKNKINITRFNKTEMNFNAKLIAKNIEYYNSLFVDKNSQLCYYNYNTTWFDKNIKNQINEQLYIKIKSEKLSIFNAVPSIIREELNAFYDCIILNKTDIKKSSLFNQIQNIRDINKKAGIQLEDFGNWVWVYEPPDPFEGLKYGIDELLLPENDTRYEDFEDIIFDKKRMIPKNPIKQIDETTFIAKLPIKHPLSKYKDIAIDYEKSAIDIEQFHGIETKIVHEVFLKFYRLWYNKIFEFSTMTMTRSVKLMLEYMYAWIMEYYPLEQTEQALRVLKLIRWYGETSIIQNSQYIVSYEYDTLYSKLNTGECLIPNDLDKDSNDTMYIDKHLGIIRNNPAYVGNTNDIDAYVTFYIDNKKNSTFTFSLSNTIGSVNIYINDALVDTVSQSALNLTYELPYTGDTNVVKIVKTAANNLNNNFFIGNIKVPNCTYKELNIEYDPTLKAGNKPLSDIAYKMVAYANIYEDREAIYEILRKSNLGNSEIYKHLLDYWNNHHSYKEKGKRLTIKEI